MDTPTAQQSEPVTSEERVEKHKETVKGAVVVGGLLAVLGAIAVAAVAQEKNRKKRR
jgi:cytochrome b